MEAYLDNSATTKCLESVRDIVVKTMMEDYGNPSSKHRKGMQAEHYINEAKERIARTMKVKEKEIFFTSGGTESNNWAILGAAMANRRSGMHIITTAIEHPAVLAPMEFLKEQGFRVTYLPADRSGIFDLNDLAAAICEDTILVSTMYVNNELGTVAPVLAAGRLLKQKHPQILYHVDAIQAYGKYRILPRKAGIDLLSVSAHKIHGPKGVGFLYINDRVKINPLLLGGGQQNGRRSGTDNVPGIAGLGAAAAFADQDLEQKRAQLYALKAYFIDRLGTLSDTVINSCLGEEGAPHIVSVGFRGVRSEVLLHALEERGVYVSSGSACSSHKKMPVSTVLKAIGLAPELRDATLRFSFSVFTNKAELDYCITQLQELLPVLRRYRAHVKEKRNV